jgi:gamma-glutamyltranspeptidase
MKQFRRAGRSRRLRSGRPLAAGLALELAKAHGGKPLDVLLHTAIRQAREGYVVRHGQTALTAKNCRVKDAPGFARHSWWTAKPPEAGKR